VGARRTRAPAEDAAAASGSRARTSTSKECVRGTHLRKGILLRRLWEEIQALMKITMIMMMNAEPIAKAKYIT
jgi:hypothetical protein